VLDKVYKGVTAKFGAAKGIAKWLIDGGLKSGFANFDAGGVGAGGCIAPILFKKKVASLLTSYFLLLTSYFLRLTPSS
jgi:hypothetical protein